MQSLIPTWRIEQLDRGLGRAELLLDPHAVALEVRKRARAYLSVSQNRPWQSMACRRRSPKPHPRQAEALELLILAVDHAHDQLVRGVAAEVGEHLVEAADCAWTGDGEVVLVEVEMFTVVEVDRQLIAHERADHRPPASAVTTFERACAASLAPRAPGANMRRTSSRWLRCLIRWP